MLRAPAVRALALAVALCASTTARGDLPPPGGDPGALDPASLTPAERATQARLHYQLGRSLFARGDFARAAHELEQGYRLAPQPAFIYNIALAHHRAGHAAAAVAAYRRYLATVPDAPERSDIESAIVALNRQEAAETAARPLDATAAPGAPHGGGSRRGLYVGVGVALGLVVVGGLGLGLGLGLGRAQAPPSSDLGTFPVLR